MNMNLEETGRRVFILALLFLVPAVKILDPVMFDPDIWWHMKTGEWVVEHGAVPQVEPFSRHEPGQPWMAYSWLFETSMYGLHRALGFTGILVYQLVMAFAIVAGLHRLICRRVPGFASGSALVFMAVFCLFPVLTPRPWLISIFLFILTLDVGLDLREGRRTRAVWLLPPLYAVWANCHIQFIYGLFVLGLTWIAPYVESHLARWNITAPPPDGQIEAGKKLFILMLACAAATLLTPYHVHLYEVIAWYMTHTGQYSYVSEMLAPGFREPSSWMMLALAGWAAVTLGRRNIRSVFLILLFLTAAACAFRAIRDIWFLAITSAAVIACAGRANQPGEREFILTPRRAVAVGMTVAAILPAVWMARQVSEQRIQQEISKLFPVAAAAEVEARGYEGPLYNHFNWGGYLIWRLPHLPVSIDGRVPVYGDKVCLQSISAWNGKSVWSSDTDLAASRLVIGSNKMPLTELLKLDPRFTLVYSDTVASVFTANPAP